MDEVYLNFDELQSTQPEGPDLHGHGGNDILISDGGSDTFVSSTGSTDQVSIDNQAFYTTEIYSFITPESGVEDVFVHISVVGVPEFPNSIDAYWI